MRPLDRVLAHLDVIEKRNGSYQALCPSHRDSKPSLNVREGRDGRVLLHCYAGCSVADITKAMNLNVADLFQRRNGSQRVAARYAYVDTAGNLLYEVVRLEPKTFRQRSPDGRGGWRWGLNGVGPVLYRLPQVLRAVAAGEPVFAVEGERDADRLSELGLTATTNPMGAGKWRDAYSETLRGARVVILPDNDNPGREHATQVAQSLRANVASVKVVKLPGLPEKGDVSDWLDRGGSVEDLLRMAREAPEWRPSPRQRVAASGQPEIIAAADLMAEDLPPVQWVVPGILPEGVTLLAAKPKLGKTWMALGLSVAVANGGMALGSRRVEQGDVLFLALEDNRRRLRKRLGMLLSGGQAPKGFYIATSWPRLGDGGAELLDKWCGDHPAVRLLVVDTLARIRPRHRSDNLYREDYSALQELLPVVAEHGIAALVVHHTRKAGADDPLDEISGSTGLTAGVDGAMVLRRERSRADAFLHVTGRDVEEDIELALRWDAETAGWIIVGDAEEYRLSRERAEIIRVLEETDQPMTPTEVADALGESTNTVKVRMWRMAGDGQLASDGGRYTLRNRYRRNPVTEQDGEDGSGYGVTEVTGNSGDAWELAGPNKTLWRKRMAELSDT
jgi:hypothetical protein